MDPPPPPPSEPPGVSPAGWMPPGPGEPPGAVPGAMPAAPPAAAPHRRRGWILIGVATVVLLAAVALFVIGTRGARFTDPTNHFSANYRDKPTEQDQSTPVGNRTISEVLWSDNIDSNTAEIVGYANFPADFSIADPHNALDGSVNGEVSNSHGSLLSKSFGTYQGFQSVDAVIAAGGGYVETRAVLAGRTLYIVVVTSVTNPPELFSSFANSLQILNHAS